MLKSLVTKPIIESPKYETLFNNPTNGSVNNNPTFGTKIH